MAKRRIKILLALALVLLGVGMGIEGMGLYEARTLNFAIEEGTIAGAEGDLPLEAAFSKAYWLARYGRYDDAAQILNALGKSESGGRKFRSALRYNLGNVYLYQAFATRKGSFISLAEESYRDALSADPGAMDAKYNLARLIKLRRAAEKKEGKKKEPTPAPKGWRFMPGPRGDNP